MFTDLIATAADGTRLHYRDYAGERVPVLCLHGLTRNARDFEGVAARLAGAGHRVIVPDTRGRGASDLADSDSYALPIYLTDLDALFARTGIERAVFFGTSMGGLLTLLTAAARPGRVIAACLNDIGPVVERAGLERIAAYVGGAPPFPDWAAAARAIAAHDAAFFPDYTPADWALHARRRCREADDRTVVFDYDAKIARNFSADPGDGADKLWPMLDALETRPSLVVRGELSDILSAHTQREMVARAPGMEWVTLPRVGHAPTLEEPEAAAAIDRLLARAAVWA